MQTFIYISLLCVLSVASALCSVLINPQIPPALSPLQRLIGCGGFSPVVSRIRMTGRKSKGGSGGWEKSALAACRSISLCKSVTSCQDCLKINILRFAHQNGPLEMKISDE